MKRFLQLIPLLIFIGASTVNAQEYHYRYRYSGTTYKAEGGGETTMTNKSSTCRLKSEFIASILPDHKTIWLYSSTINERCKGNGTYKNGGYTYKSALSETNIFELIGECLPTGSFSIFLSKDNRRIICITNEQHGEYFTTRYDYYAQHSAVPAPNNQVRIETDRMESERKIESSNWKQEYAQEQAKREAERAALESKQRNSVGKPFPMASFVDSHGNRISNSYFKRGKKTLVITSYFIGTVPERELKAFLNSYPQIASQIITIDKVSWKYSEHSYNTSAPIKTNHIYYNPDEGSNRDWIYGEFYPCIILLDENGNVLDYEFGFNKKRDLGYMTDIVNQLRGKSNGAPYQIGDYYNDGKNEGIVFEVYNNGYSGKIVSLKHSDKIKRWRNRGSLDIGKTFGATDGRDIMHYRRLSESITEDDAFGWCNRQGMGWYLPTIEELKSIYANRAVIEPKLTHKFAKHSWSCTESSDNAAYFISNNGYIGTCEKHYGCYVRAVKTFGKRVPRAKQKTTSAPYKIGDFYNENNKMGIVFEVNADGTSGKIYTISPVSEARWASDQSEVDNLVGANDSSDGANNLEAVMRIPDWQSKYPAFAACAKLGDGWYLPAIDELGKIVKIREDCVIPIPIVVDVWSSTEDYSRGKVGAWSRGYITNNSKNQSWKTNKHNEYRVYAVTRFGESENSKNISYEQSHSPYKVGDLYNEDSKLGVVVETWDSGRSGKILSLAESRKTWSDAECYCKSLGDGWRLPTVEELRLLSLDKNHYNAIEKTFERYGSDLNGSYWSSTKSGNTILNKYPTSYIVWSDGVYSEKPTCNYYSVRAITEFGTTPRPTTTLARGKTSAPYKVGDYYNDGEKDGIVFEVKSGGKHGKIVSINYSITTQIWYSGSYDDKYGKSSVGTKSKIDGAKNMTKIAYLKDWRAYYPAFRWCTELGEGWYLPAIEELVTIYNNKSLIDPAVLANLNKSHFVSSTESGKRHDKVSTWKDKHKTVLAIDMSDGDTYQQYRDNYSNILAVAKF